MREGHALATLTARVLRLAADLRRLGSPVGPGEAAEALAALERVGLQERGLVRAALRCTLARTPEAAARFDALFARHFRAGGAEPAAAVGERRAAGAWAADGRWGAREGAPGAAGGYSPHAAGGATEAGGGEEGRLERAARRLLRQLVRGRGRRYRPARCGGRPDLRRLLRRAAAGEAVPLPLRAREPKVARLVALCDVSRSMEPYARLFLRFVHALGRCAPGRVEAFAFSTALRRVTPALRTPDPEQALARVAASLPEWGGGTRIGDCLLAWCRAYGPALLGRRTVIAILSDGLDLGEPASLRRALERMRRGSWRILWLNPLAADPRFRPETRALRVALPYLDALLPAADAGGLERLGRHLAAGARAPGRRGRDGEVGPWTRH